MNGLFLGIGEASSNLYYAMNIPFYQLHITLVYLRNRVLSLPFAAVLVTSAFVLSGGFSILLTISVLWTMFHSVTQKIGITRVYSRKAGYGEAWIEKGFIYSWFFYLFIGMAQEESNTILNYTSGRTILAIIGNYLDIFTWQLSP